MKIRVFNLRKTYQNLRLRWRPRYRIESEMFFPNESGQVHTYQRWDGFGDPAEEIATDLPSNDAMVPINWSARLRVYWWQRSLKRSLPKQRCERAAKDATGGYFQSFSEAELKPIDNYIPAPRETWTFPEGRGRGWYANPPSQPVVSIADRAASLSRNPPVKSPWLQPKKD
jgi:hypothetical protein